MIAVRRKNVWEPPPALLCSTVQYSTVHSVEAVCAVERGLARVRRAGGVRGRAAGRGGARVEDAAPEDQVTQPSQDTWP